MSASTVDRDLAALRNAGFTVRSVRGRSGGLIADSDDSVVDVSANLESTPTFIGRESQLHELLQTVTAPRAVRSLSGEPGIGKSSLLQEFGSRCGDRGIKVLHAECVDLPGAPPLEPWRQILGSALGPAESNELISHRGGGNGSDLSNIDHVANRFRFFETICLKLSNSVPQASVIVFDDLHNADPTSVDLLEHLISSANNSKFSVVFAYNNRAISRYSSLQRFLGRLVSKRKFRRLNIGPFDTEEIDELIRRLSPRRFSDQERTEVHTRSEGNPHFATELINHFSLDRPDDLIGGRF